MRRLERSVEYMVRNVPAKLERIGLLKILISGLACTFQTAMAGTIYGINHTHWAINRFSVNGHPAMDGIDPYQRGGGGWGYTADKHWHPSMWVRVDWETGVAFSDDFPGYADEDKYLAWRNKMRAQKRQHAKQIPLPNYTGQKNLRPDRPFPALRRHPGHHLLLRLRPT